MTILDDFSLASADSMSVRLFGIRHHGPGCARALLAGLQQYRPDVVLIEGPADAQEPLKLIGHPDLRPPLALLVYPRQAPQQAVSFPLAEYSPEWQALLFAVRLGLPIRLMDLPHGARLSRESENRAQQPQPQLDQDERPDQTQPGQSSETGQPGESFKDCELSAEARVVADPLSLLAQAAGYADYELWWDQQIEQRQDPTDVFEAIDEAMVVLRQEALGNDLAASAEEALREAHMRQSIRQAQANQFQRIAVICGAWHVPALKDLDTTAISDKKLLATLKPLKTLATWIPWTYNRLATRSGYRAGVASPGWYEHLWQHQDQAAARWAIRAGRLLREEDLEASSASIIETLRMAEALAALRNRSAAGLQELSEAIHAVLCRGDATPMALIRQRLEVGSVIGSVPAETPAVPLQRDLEAEAKRLRLTFSDEQQTKTLDLREPTGAGRSRLLRRLNLLNVNWGTLIENRDPAGLRVGMGTFKEVWELLWQPELTVAVIEANTYGNTLQQAAASRVSEDAQRFDRLPELTELLQATLPAELPAAAEAILQRLQVCAAGSAEVQHLLAAVGPLVAAKYEQTRHNLAQQVEPILHDFVERGLVGLPAACVGLNDESAEHLVVILQQFHNSLTRYQNEPYLAKWFNVVTLLAGCTASLQERTNPLGKTAPGRIRGWCCRLLLAQGRLQEKSLHRQVQLELGPATPPQEAAAWVAGLLSGTGQQIVHQDHLWAALDGWLSRLQDKTFLELLPLLRRAFSEFQPAERRMMREKVGQLPAQHPQAEQALHPQESLAHQRLAGEPLASETRASETLASETLASETFEAELGDPAIDHRRAKQVFPVLAQILGASTTQTSSG